MLAKKKQLSTYFNFSLDVNRYNMGASSPVPTYRFCGVTGYDGRTNDLVYCYPSNQAKEQSTVVYFGGDMQVR